MPKTYEVPPLTREEINLVRKTWAVVYKDPEGHGAVILKTFLDKHDYYYKFERFKNFPREDITNNPVFRNHCLKLMQTLDAAIQSLDDPDKLGPMLVGLGKGHAKRKIQKIQFEHLRVVVLDLLTSAFQIAGNEKAAWGRMFDNVLPLIFKGLTAEQ